MWLFRKRQGKTQAHPQIKTEEPTRPFEELCHPEDREQLEKIALDVTRSAKERSIAIDKLSCPDSKETLEYCSRNDDEPLNRVHALAKLSYPESREVLCYAAQHDWSSYVQAEAVKLLPYPQEAKLLFQIANRPVSPVFSKSDSKVPKAAQRVLINAGVCPGCGAKTLIRETYTASRDDDPDFEYETEGYLCSECNWHEK